MPKTLIFFFYEHLYIKSKTNQHCLASIICDILKLCLISWLYKKCGRETLICHRPQLLKYHLLIYACIKRKHVKILQNMDFSYLFHFKKLSIGKKKDRRGIFKWLYHSLFFYLYFLLLSIWNILLLQFRSHLVYFDKSS